MSGRPTWLQRALLAVFLLAVFFYSFNQLREPDAFYHLRTGQLIVQTGHIPHADVYSSSAAGAPWTPHEWLAQVLFYLCYRVVGFVGLAAAIAILSAATYFLVHRLALRRGGDPLFSALFLFLFGFLTFELWIPRPQVFAFFATALLLYCLERYRQQPQRRYLIIMVADMLFWANVHASVLLGAVIVLFYALMELTKNWLPQWLGRPLSPRARAELWLASLAAVLVCFINPSGYRVFTYVLEVAPAVKALGILEWQPITAFTNIPQTDLFLAEMLLGAALLVWWFGWRRESRDLTWLGAVLGVSVLPFIAIRHVGFWSLVAVAPLIVAVSGVLRPAFDRVKQFSYQNIAVVLFVLGLLFAAARAAALLLVRPPIVNADSLPVDAVNFIEANQVSGPLFNLYNEGGYLIWRLWPQQKVFIDGRSEVYAGAPVNEFFDITRNAPDWQQLVDDKYHINYFFLAYRPSSLAQSIRPLQERLERDGWVVVYWDDVIVIYVRNTPANKDLIAKYGVHEVSPFRDPASVPPGDRQKALEELQSLSERSSQVQVLRAWADAMMAARGQDAP